MSYKVKKYMNKEVETIDAEASGMDVAKQMTEKQVGYLIVLEKGKARGIVTEKDLITKVMAAGVSPASVKVKGIASKPLISVDPDTNLEDVVKLMGQKDVRRVAVVKEGILYGIFTAKDLASHFNEYEDQITKDLVKNLYCPF